MTDDKPSYYAVIPADVRYDNDLISGAKLLYAEITSLCNKDGKCFASNRYFAELYGVSIKSISIWVNTLVNKGYLKSELVYKQGTKEVECRYLSLPYGRNLPYPQKKTSIPMEEKVKDNNKYNNNILLLQDTFLSSLDSEWKSAMEKWIEYRKNIKRPLKEVSFESCYDKLIELSSGDIQTALDIIKQSIANGWQGLFPLKEKQVKFTRTSKVDKGKQALDNMITNYKEFMED